MADTWITNLTHYLDDYGEEQHECLVRGRRGNDHGGEVFQEKEAHEESAHDNQTPLISWAPGQENGHNCQKGSSELAVGESF